MHKNIFIIESIVPSNLNIICVFGSGFFLLNNINKIIIIWCSDIFLFILCCHLKVKILLKKTVWLHPSKNAHVWCHNLMDWPYLTIFRGAGHFAVWSLVNIPTFFYRPWHPQFLWFNHTISPVVLPYPHFTLFHTPSSRFSINKVWQPNPSDFFSSDVQRARIHTHNCKYEWNLRDFFFLFFTLEGISYSHYF